MSKINLNIKTYLNQKNSQKRPLPILPKRFTQRSNDNSNNNNNSSQTQKLTHFSGKIEQTSFTIIPKIICNSIKVSDSLDHKTGTQYFLRQFRLSAKDALSIKFNKANAPILTLDQCKIIYNKMVETFGEKKICKALKNSNLNIF